MSPQVAQGDGEWGLRSVRHTLALQLRPPRALPLPQRGVPSTGDGSPRAAPVWGPYCGVQSLRNRLLQRGSLMGSQALPANLLRRGLLSPQGHRSWQESVLLWALRGVTASFRHPLLWCGVLSGLWVGVCSPTVCSMSAGTACPTTVCSMAAGEPSSPAPGAPPALLLHWPGGLQSCCSRTDRILSLAADFFSPSEISYLRGATSIPWPAVGPILELAGIGFIGRGEVSSTFSQKPPQQPPATKTLPHKPHAVSNRVMLKFIAKVLGFPGFFVLGTSVIVADCMKTEIRSAEMSFFFFFVQIVSWYLSGPAL